MVANMPKQALKNFLFIFGCPPLLIVLLVFRIIPVSRVLTQVHVYVNVALVDRHIQIRLRAHL